MNFARRCALLLTFAVTFTLFSQSQTAANSSATNANPPRLIRFAGVLKDASAKPGMVGMTFALYSSEEGGAPLWMETQSVEVAAGGHYSVILGAASKDGMPLDFFVAGEARWLGIAIDGKEQARVLLVSVPYAIKASDADTVGGMSASQIAAQAASMVGTTTTATNSVFGPSGTAALIRNTSGSLITTSATAAGATNFTANTTDQVVTMTQTGTGHGLVIQVPTGGSKLISGQVNGTELFAVNNLGTVIGKGLAFSNNTNASVFSAVNTSTVPTDTAVTFVASASNGLGKAFQGNQFSTTGNTVAIYGLNYSTTGTGVLGLGNATSGANVGIWGLTKSSAGTGVLSQVPSGGKLFSGVTTAVGEVFSISSAGAVNASSFTGDGTNITNVNAFNLINGIRVISPGVGLINDVFGGYNFNGTTGIVQGAAVGGGGNLTDGGNIITDDYGFIGGGAGNQAGDNAGTAIDATYAIVGGGYKNKASASYAFTGGGNTNNASGQYSTVGGGFANQSSNSFAGVLSGAQNGASGFESVISGGAFNTATTDLATVGGGYLNHSTGSYSTVPGGYNNTATGYASFAAGKYATANHNNSFVWGDGTLAYTGLNFDNAFSVLATGGVVFSTHQTTGTIDQYVSLDTNGVVTASGGFSGNGSQLTNVSGNAVKLQSVVLSGVAPTTGQALRYNGSQWAPSSFFDSHYYPVGTCTDTTNYPQWSNFHGYNTNFQCITTGSFLNTLVVADDYSFNGLSGPVFSIPADWDGNTFYADTDWYLPSASGTININYYAMCSNPGSPINGTNAGGPILLGAGVSDTNIRHTTGAVPMPAGCGANSVVHLFIGRGDGNVTPGPIYVIGTNIRIGRNQ